MENIRIAAVTSKYTQSNSVCFAQNGQCIGVGAGQQSRVDAVKLAAAKAQSWQLRCHPKVLQLPFKSELKRQQRVNGRVAYMQAYYLKNHPDWNQFFSEGNYPERLTKEEIDAWTKHMALNNDSGDEDCPLSQSTSALCAVSDGFFPFRDSIDLMAKNHVKWVMHPGGSVADHLIREAVESHRMGLIESGVRLFLH